MKITRAVVPSLFTVLNIFCGFSSLIHSSDGDYVLASWSGMLPGTILYVSIGAAAQSLTEITSGRPQGGTAQKVLFGCGLLATVIVSVLLTRIAKKALANATVAAQE